MQNLQEMVAQGDAQGDGPTDMLDGVWVPCNPLMVYRNCLLQLTINGSECLDAQGRRRRVRHGPNGKVLVAGGVVELCPDGTLSYRPNEFTEFRFQRLAAAKVGGELTSL